MMIEAIKNLYVLKTIYFFPLMSNDSAFSSICFYWYNLPIKYDPNNVEISNIIGTYPEYYWYPQSTRKAGVQN